MPSSGIRIRRPSDVFIRFGTTSVDPEDPGSTLLPREGMTKVFTGSLSISSAYNGPPNGPRAFDVVIPFQTPFLYHRDAGHLVFDFENVGRPSSHARSFWTPPS